MRLYVWNNPYRVSYGDSLLIVVAESEEDAKAEALRGTWWTFGEFPRMAGSVPTSIVAKLGSAAYCHRPCGGMRVCAMSLITRRVSG